MTHQTETDKLVDEISGALRFVEVGGYRGAARAALRAIYEAGYVVVPREMTEEMFEVTGSEGCDAWAYILEASPIKLSED